MTDYPGGGYGGQPGYGEQPGYGRQPGYGPQPGWGGPPKKRHTNAIIAGVMALVVVAGGVLAAVLFTGGDGNSSAGFGSSLGTSAAPTGFPSTDDSSSAPSGGSTGADYTVDFLVVEYFDDLDSQDYEGLTGLTCQGYETRLSTTVVSEVTAAMAGGAAQVSGTAATASGSVVLTDGTARTLTITMAQQSDEKWCVSGETAIR